MEIGKILKSIKKKTDKDNNTHYEVNVQYILNDYDTATELIKQLKLE